MVATKSDYPLLENVLTNTSIEEVNVENESYDQILANILVQAGKIGKATGYSAKAGVNVESVSSQVLFSEIEILLENLILLATQIKKFEINQEK